MSRPEFLKRVAVDATELGFILVRYRRHQIWRHPLSGQTVVCSSSPSDHRTWLNVRAQLRRAARATLR